MRTADEILKEKGRHLLSVSPDTTIFEAVKIMNEKRVGAVLIKENEKIVGIYTERDLLKNSKDENFNSSKAKIRDFMTTDLVSADINESVMKLADKIIGLRLRHLLIKEDEEYVGMVSAGDVMRASLLQKTEELRKLNDMVSWEYYENWRWKDKD